jgi:hypothetical protein
MSAVKHHTAGNKTKDYTQQQVSSLLVNKDAYGDVNVHSSSGILKVKKTEDEISELEI